MKATIEQIEYLIAEMKKAQSKHPEAKIYYDWEDSEIRITYPLPKDYLSSIKKEDEKTRRDA